MREGLAFRQSFSLYKKDGERNMADILLTVGVDTSLSYAEFQSGITSLVSKINSNPPKIKIAFDIDQTAANKLKQQVSSMYTTLGKSGSRISGTSYMQELQTAQKLPIHKFLLQKRTSMP